MAATIAPPTSAAPPAVDLDEGTTARINFRLPDQLKSRIEEAANRDGLSVNAWLVRATTAAVRGATAGPTRPPSHGHTVGGQRYTGWVR
ncbi:toxin-antitoxin system HicB family antitoxin [Micromonospora zhanjiangensis]